MLLLLAQWLGQDVRLFNVFNYITLRTVLAALTALAISFVSGPGVIRWLAAKKIGQAVRTDGPQTHLAKSGTPTMYRNYAERSADFIAAVGALPGDRS